MSIRLRLTAWYTGILAVTLLVFCASIYGIVRYNIFTEVKNKILDQANPTLASLNVTTIQGFDLTPDISQRIRLEDSQIFWQTHSYISGLTQVSTGLKNRAMQFPVPDLGTLGSNPKAHFENVTVGGNFYSVLIVPITATVNGQAGVIGLVQLAANTAAENRIMDQLWHVLLIGSIITIVVASTFGLFLARTSMRPIGKVIDAANQIQTGNDLSVRIDYDGPQDEIGRLIGTVNRMLERTETFYNELDQAYGAQRRFVSDASHELRTPLTTIRGNVDLLKKVWTQEDGAGGKLSQVDLHQMSVEAVSDIADEASRMSRLVNDMLSLARADAGQTIEKTAVEMEPLVTEVIRRAQFLPRKAEWLQGDLSALEGAVVEGDRDYLQQMLFIFIENAFKYTPSGKVVIDTLKNDGQLGIRIADTGIGMERSEVEHIFDRFYRADQSRGVTPGTGLGLSIGKWIIDEHRGSVEVFTRKGEGTTFLIWLPAAFNAAKE
ncbi:sensor histidine kinase [Paenibacillus physcomitrellae]|uniref:histidine kinase n=1 Tax=Paenibacillus physcomitrellae TaxID=1619311 RepID=A0ABQ1G7S3_9BACL|nr:HAMP domain-containing sensor histidine kinase [Paenibacillus physcomitrellae]GGA38437.1 two-component sensor histidine kinase [Paenibacillus physcomitrellae]